MKIQKNKNQNQKFTIIPKSDYNKKIQIIATQRMQRNNLSFLADHNTSHISHIYGSMNSIYYVDQSCITNQRFIRVKGQHPENMQLSKAYTEEDFNSQIQISSLTAWLILLTSVLFSAFVPCWLLADVRSESLTRNSWRYFMMSIMSIPFLMYEQRSVKEERMKLWNLLTVEKLKPIFIATINFSVWLICLIYACRFTSMNHALCLSYLRFFLISVLKMVKKERIHEFQIAGSLLCTLGVILVMSDSITLPQLFGPDHQHYKTVQPWKRLVLGDGLGIIASFVSVYLDQNFVIPEMPRFTYLYLYNLFLSFNLMTSGYFFGGSSFDFNTKFGVFGLFTYENFVSALYVSIMLGMYLMIANLLTSQIFNDVIINAGFTFQLILTSIAWSVLGLEKMPANMTCLGYAFITPGLMFVIGGQAAIEDKEHKMNLQLYRPTQIDNTYIESANGGRYSLDSPSESSPAKRKETYDKMPFEMILEEDENQGKNVKNQ